MILKGKNVVITGCLKGIGRSTMELFARHGANVWACCQTPTEEFESHIREIAAATGASVVPVYFDLTESEQIKEGMKTIMSSKRSIDVLVNVAGLTHNSLFHMTTVESMRQLFEVDFFSQMLITQYITKLMVRQKSGNVINVASVTGIDGNPGQVAYSAAKAALIGATKTLAIELAEHNIRVNAVAPGVIRTDMTTSLAPDKLDELIRRVVMRRSGLPEEVANVMLFLASDLSSYVTGQVLRIDGGMQ
jgi:3-oxoacyl-[acyl-carrier protein] reductase